MYNLYVKQHNKTGLKYLGQTQQDPYKYQGSGVRWLNHLNKHGIDISTYIIGTYENKEQLIIQGQYYSSLWNIVKSEEWANLIEEVGDGGSFKYHTKETKEKLRQIALKNFSEEIRQKIIQANLGRKHSEITNKKKGSPGNKNAMRNPQVVENFRKLVTGRKRVYREDGSWFWYNPNKKVANG